eukprot:TRINITY_DN31080_c0_g1_i1.p1 TRINITY_DN31080_c0_g1~~TRINITY_DN31080_c0_g1_i1.p1  ORF type:complete len:342 (-),score=46.41 TRINITY_DN31080_c0_g1_i1:271-1296(-)
MAWPSSTSKVCFAWCLLVISSVLPVSADDLKLWGAEQIISVRPLIIAVPSFASAEECRAVRALLERCHQREWQEGCKEVRSNLQVPPNKSASTTTLKPLRNSTSFQLTVDGELDPTIDAIVRRAHLLARHPVTFGEGVQVAEYVEGEYYGFHHDALHRRATFLMYLNDVPEGGGGETIFPLVRAQGIPLDAEPPLPSAVMGKKRESYLGYQIKRFEDMLPYCASDFYLKIRPQAGLAILFFGYGPDDTLDEYAVHASCPLRGQHRKAILQRWMRFKENTLFEKASAEVQKVRTKWGHERLMHPREAEEDATTTTRVRRLSVTTEPGKAGDADAEGGVPPEL